MDKTKNKIIPSILFWTSIIAAVAHLIWCAFDKMSIGIESIFLNVLPYGIPIFAFARARKGEAVSRADNVLCTLFSLSYLAMIVHVTVAGIIDNDSFTNIYLNLPLIYLFPITLFGLGWMLVHTMPRKGSRVMHKILYTVLLLVIGAMVLHCGIVAVRSIIRYASGPIATSFPWWASALYTFLYYVIPVLAVLLIYGLYYWFINRRKK